MDTVAGAGHVYKLYTIKGPPWTHDTETCVCRQRRVGIQTVLWERTGKDCCDGEGGVHCAAARGSGAVMWLGRVCVAARGCSSGGRGSRDEGFALAVGSRPPELGAATS